VGDFGAGGVSTKKRGRKGLSIEPIAIMLKAVSKRQIVFENKVRSNENAEHI
jgi:hypothetical protein